MTGRPRFAGFAMAAAAALAASLGSFDPEPVYRKRRQEPDEPVLSSAASDAENARPHKVRKGRDALRHSRKAQLRAQQQGGGPRRGKWKLK